MFVLPENLFVLDEHERAVEGGDGVEGAAAAVGGGGALRDVAQDLGGHVGVAHVRIGQRVVVDRHLRQQLAVVGDKT